MYGFTTIDNTNLLQRFGAFVTKEGWNELLDCPQFKAIRTNDWHEENGIEADLTAPQVAARQFNIGMAVSDKQRYKDFLQFLTAKASCDWSDPSLPRVFSLRWVDVSDLKYTDGLYLFNLKVAEDLPIIAERQPQPPQGMTQQAWRIDGNSFSDYGAKILQGAEQSLWNVPNVKKNLTVSVSNDRGTTYDNEGRVSVAHREVTLPLLWTDSDKQRLWNNYDALLYTLTKAGEHKLISPTHSRALPCYYKSLQVEHFFDDPERIWLQATLTLVLTDGGAPL